MGVYLENSDARVNQELLVNVDLLVVQVTKDLLAHQDHLEPTVLKANLDYKELAEFLDLKVPSEAKETKELPLLDQPERLAYLDHLVPKVLPVTDHPTWKTSTSKSIILDLYFHYL